MSGEPAFIRVLRESVEAEVTPSVASSALFAALSAWGTRVPSSFLEVVDLVRGPLRAELDHRLGEARAGEIEKRIEHRLRFAEMPTGPLGVVPKDAFAEIPTRAMPRADGPLTLAVIAGSPVLETLVIAALGPHRVMTSEEPAMLVLDASDPPASWGGDLELRAHAAPTVCLYGIDLPHGRAASARLDSAKVEFLGFEVEHGIAPLLDLIRSRAR